MRSPIVESGYEDFLRSIRSSASTTDPAKVAALLDGFSAAELRRTVSLGERRELGAFFTSHELADQLAAPLGDATGELVIADPTCGAGDLLLAAIRHTASAVRREQATVKLIGVDTVAQFASAARLRLDLQAEASRSVVSVAIHQGDGVGSKHVASATHLLMNPPFSLVRAPDKCSWGSGKVNAAAIFMLDRATNAAPNTVVHAILPDVLRSGSRYAAWRRQLDQRFDVLSIERVGKFDRWTDVDVFMLRGQTRPEDVDVNLIAHSSPLWPSARAGGTVSDRFAVSVGAVVHYRDPIEGDVHPYVVARDFPAWSRIDDVEGTRRFHGRLHTPPFVAIPRTSRPGDKWRARGAVVAGKRPVAVDNHLIVATPKRPTLKECHALLRLLKSPVTTEWLDERIRLRHLTVDAVGSIPWEGAK